MEVAVSLLTKAFAMLIGCGLRQLLSRIVICVTYNNAWYSVIIIALNIDFRHSLVSSNRTVILTNIQSYLRILSTHTWGTEPLPLCCRLERYLKRVAPTRQAGRH